MAKIQGILPVYDTNSKRLLGAYLLPFAKTFDGSETTHNIDHPNTSNATNTVPVMKVTPNNPPINGSRKQGDWYMAAYFTQSQNRAEYYRNFKNFQFVSEMSPDSDWVAPATGQQFRVNWGALIQGLESGFLTGAVNELAPKNTVAPTATGTKTVGQTITAVNGTWTAGGSITYAYQWLRDGVNIAGATAGTYLLAAGDAGKTVSLRVTATYSGYSAAADSIGYAIP